MKPYNAVERLETVECLVECVILALEGPVATAIGAQVHKHPIGPERNKTRPESAFEGAPGCMVLNVRVEGCRESGPGGASLV